MLLERFVLHIHAGRLLVWRAQAWKVVREREFLAHAEGYAAFAEWLGRHKRALFYALADLPEESFQWEEVPAVRGKDRQQLIQRKLAQHFYATPFALAESRGRSGSGRKDERLLLMALSSSAHLEPWLASLRENRAPLVGLYSVPQLCERLAPTSEPHLLILRTAAGLRQSFFLEGKLRFSRLTPLLRGDMQEAAEIAAQETDKIFQYLVAQHWISRDQALTTRILAHSAELEAYHRFCLDSPVIHYEFFSLRDVALRLGYSPREAIESDALLAYLLLRKTPAAQFAPPPFRQAFRLWQVRRGLQGSAVVSLLACALFATKQALEIAELQPTLETLAAQSQSNLERRAQMLKQLPASSLSGAELKVFLGRFEDLERSALGPAPLWTQISRSFDAFPEITLERLEWSLIDPQQGTQGRAELPSGMDKGAAAQAILTCRLPLAMAYDRRRQLTLVNDFVGHLSRAERTHAQILSPPVDTESGKTMKSGDDRVAPEAPRFTVRVIKSL
ncbi:MAG: hypothetical protein N2441_04120 [Rhodocyclaceae bacterium]|nr:hypothetical protein [Rhodocyclaceae bacterium]